MIKCPSWLLLMGRLELCVTRLRYAQIHGLLYGQMFTAQRRPTTSLLVPASQPGHHSRAQRPAIRLSLTGHQSCRATVDTVLQPDIRRYIELDAQGRRSLDARSSGAHLADTDIVWSYVPTVQIPFLVQHMLVMRQAFAACLVVIDQPNLATDGLREPDRGAIANSQVPGRVNKQHRIMGNRGYPVLLMSLGQHLSIDRTTNRRFIPPTPSNARCVSSGSCKSCSR